MGHSGNICISLLNVPTKMILATVSLFYMTSLPKEKGSTSRMFIDRPSCRPSDICLSKEPASARLASNLTKIFAERGFDIFEKRDGPSTTDEGPDTFVDDDLVDEKGAAQKPMTVDELYAMRVEVMPHLLFVYFFGSYGTVSRPTIALLWGKCLKQRTS